VNSLNPGRQNRSLSYKTLRLELRLFARDHGNMHLPQYGHEGTAMAKPKFDITNIADYRKKLGLNQQAFWSGLGVTQSGGSRYESGRNLPKPVAMLLALRETGKVTVAELDAVAALVKKAKAKG
jgi:DNA-binding transcriptional regulator YiaG